MSNNKDLLKECRELLLKASEYNITQDDYLSQATKLLSRIDQALAVEDNLDTTEGWIDSKGRLPAPFDAVEIQGKGFFNRFREMTVYQDIKWRPLPKAEEGNG